MRVLFLVLDGVSPRHVGHGVMPVLDDLARSGGWWPEGAVGVMPTSTYPNHATFLTGVAPDRHGIVANEIPTAAGTVTAWGRGPRSATLFDSVRAGGRRSAAVFGDHHLVGVTGAHRADSVWPADGFTPHVDLDVLGYAKDRETAARLVEEVDGDADLLVAQFNETDTAAHVFGPDAPEALRRYGRADAQLGVVLERLRPEWEEWVVIVVSDHSQETVTEPDPIDLRAAAGSVGLDGVVVDDGAVAVVAGAMAGAGAGAAAGAGAWLEAVPGVEGTSRIDDDTVLAWATPGRWFSSVPLPVRGVHGSPRTAPQVAVVAGGHPAADHLVSGLGAGRPRSTGWAGAIAGLLGIPAPDALTVPG
jgi:arylsulfatase A-like enzyme